MASAHLTSAQLSAICAPVAVAIGIAVAYLTLDRFRYHKRIVDLANSLNKVIDTAPNLVRSIEENKQLTQIEKNFLALHYLCGTTDVAEIVQKHKSDIFNGGLDTFLRFLLTLLTHWKVDRIAAGALCAFLCLWELYVSYVLFCYDPPPAWFGSNLVKYITFGAVFGAYIVPLLGFACGELVILLIKQSVRRWTEEENVRQTRQAQEATVPPVNGIQAAPAAAEPTP